MFARIPSASLSHWGRSCLVLALLGLPLYASCTSSEDTEPFVPASQGASQPEGKGALVSEEDACSRLLKAAKSAYDRLDCTAPDFPTCPDFLRPGGGNGCYEYYDGSVTACVKTYGDASSCEALSPCLATAERNDDLETCVRVDPVDGTGGAGGASPVVTTPGGAAQGGAEPVGPDQGGMAQGGASPLPQAGDPSMSGSPATAGQSAGGAGP